MANLIRVKDFEDDAKTNLCKTYFEFFMEGSGHQETVNNNIKAYKRFKVKQIDIYVTELSSTPRSNTPIKKKYRIRPRYLRNVEHRILSRNILGRSVSFPIGISPTAVQKLAHSDGECATAKAAQELNTIFILSSHSTSTIDEVVAAAPTGRKWMQCYAFQSREVAQDLVNVVEKAGFEAIVLTVDFPVLGLRYHAAKNKMNMPKHLSFAIIKKYLENGTIRSPQLIGDPSVDWSYIKWLTSITKLPIIAKGILTAEDAILAVEAGVSAILVSNHGGRQLDGVPSTIEALPEVVKAVGDKVEIYVDGGIRDGTDVYKALGLGAKMVFVGRPAVWGLAQGGEEGVKNVLNILKNELDKALAISGCSNLEELTPERVVHKSFYAKM